MVWSRVKNTSKMSTKFKLIFETEEPDIDLPKFRQSLPPVFEVTEEDNGIYITIPSQKPEDEQCQYLIDRELDRHFFLTSVKIRAEIVRKIFTVSFVAKNRLHGSLPEGIAPQIIFQNKGAQNSRPDSTPEKPKPKEAASANSPPPHP